MSRTVDVLAETSMICPITPPELHTGIPTSNPEAEPLSMITESVQASPVEADDTRGRGLEAVGRLKAHELLGRSAVSCASESSATWAVSSSLRFLSSESVSEERSRVLGDVAQGAEWRRHGASEHAHGRGDGHDAPAHGMDGARIALAQVEREQQKGDDA